MADIDYKALAEAIKKSKRKVQVMGVELDEYTYEDLVTAANEDVELEKSKKKLKRSVEEANVMSDAEYKAAMKKMGFAEEE